MQTFKEVAAVDLVSRRKLNSAAINRRPVSRLLFPQLGTVRLEESHKPSCYVWLTLPDTGGSYEAVTPSETPAHLLVLPHTPCDRPPHPAFVRDKWTPVLVVFACVETQAHLTIPLSPSSFASSNNCKPRSHKRAHCSAFLGQMLRVSTLGAPKEVVSS